MKIASVRSFIILFIFAMIFLAIAIPNFEEARTRSRVAQTYIDLRRVSNALEAYFVDHHAYPRAVPLRNFANDPEADSEKISMSYSMDPHITPLEKFGGLHRLATDPGLTTHGVAGLTTPVAYIDKLPADPWVNRESEEHIPFAYYVYNDIPEPGWILYSPGPDGDYDITPTEFYHPPQQKLTNQMRVLGYNPLYGEISNGDIFRFKQ